MGKGYKYIHISLHKRKIRSLHDLKILKPDPKQACGYNTNYYEPNEML